MSEIDKRLAKGIRNKNPTNLVHVEKNKWQGLARPPNAGRFCVFTDMAFGIRAAALNLIAYQDRYNIDTVRELVERWAPHNENDVEAYIKTVCRVSGFTEKEPLDLHKFEHLKPLLKGMIRQEVGGDAKHVSESELDEGLRRAGIVPESKPVAKDVAVTVTGVAASLGVVAQAVAQIEAIWTGLQGVHPMLPHIAVGVAGLAGVGVLFYILGKRLMDRRRGIA